MFAMDDRATTIFHQGITVVEQDSLQRFKLVGDVQEAIARASSLREALVKCLRFASELADVQMCVLWAMDTCGDQRLHPIYWIGPEDLTSKTVAPGAGTVGRVFQSSTFEAMLDFDPQRDPETQRPFEVVTVRSSICVPLPAGQGCIHMINKNDGSLFLPEVADELNAMVAFAAKAFEASDPLEEPTVDWARPIIEARDVTREFQNGDQVIKVLQGVNLNVYEGEFLTVLGESGCGKSTFLNIIGGMDQATSGHFTFEGRDLSHATQAELTRYRRDNIGFIFQGYNLMPNLTALQNLQLIAELVDHPMDCREALRLVGLEDRMDQYPSQLSGGQQQRVSIARALVKNPKIIFADEPTAALDYATSIEVLQVLQSVLKRGTTLVMVTHNAEITRMANRVVRIRRGLAHEFTINRRPVDATELVW